MSDFVASDESVSLAIAEFFRGEDALFLGFRGSHDGGDDVLLWRSTYRQLRSEMNRLMIDPSTIDLERLKTGMMSAHSSAGNSCARLLRAFASQAYAVPEDSEGLRLVAYRTDLEFQEAIKRLKQDTLTVQDVQTRFYVRKEYIEAVCAPRVRVTYPDSLSVFSSGLIRIAEHKLSGDNDSKAVEKNLEVLQNLRYEVDQTYRVETVIALPFTDASSTRSSRWSTHRKKPDVVSSNEAVWSTLLALPISTAHYQRCAEALAHVAASTALVPLLSKQPDQFFYSPESHRWERSAD